MDVLIEKKHLDFHAKCVHPKIYAFMLLEKILSPIDIVYTTYMTYC